MPLTVQRRSRGVGVLKVCRVALCSQGLGDLNAVVGRVDLLLRNDVGSGILLLLWLHENLRLWLELRGEVCLETAKLHVGALEGLALGAELTCEGSWKLRPTVTSHALQRHKPSSSRVLRVYLCGRGHVSFEGLGDLGVASDVPLSRDGDGVDQLN